METLKKIVEWLIALKTPYRWIIIILSAVLIAVALLASTSCSVSTKLTGTKVIIDTCHYQINSYTKNYNSNILN